MNIEDPEIARACAGDEAALSRLFAAYVRGLERFIEFRLDAVLRRRLEPADVVQQALLIATERFPEWCRTHEPPFRLWLRLLTAQSLAEARRRHLGSLKRDAQRELADGWRTDSVSVGRVLASSQTTPSSAAQRSELVELVTRALAELSELDREVLILRQFERLTNEEVATELSIEPAAASKRFVRALARLRPALERLGLA